MKTFLNAVPDATLFGSILLAYLLDRATSTAETIPYPFSLIGWITFAAGVILTLRTMTMLKRKRASSDVTGVSSALITTDVFAHSRNPLYVAYVLMTLGTALVLGSVVAFIAPIICFTVLEVFIIPFEEKNLENTFGQKYTAYKRAVRRWL